jgi:hypothetical protein
MCGKLTILVISRKIKLIYGSEICLACYILVTYMDMIDIFSTLDNMAGARGKQQSVRLQYVMEQTRVLVRWARVANLLSNLG